MAESDNFFKSFNHHKLESDARILCWNHLIPLLAVALEHGTILIFTAIDCVPLLTLKAHSGQINDLKWSPSGLFLASSAEDGLIKVWSMRSNLPVISHKCMNPVNSIAWSATEDTSLLYITTKGQLIQYNINEFSEKLLFENPDLSVVSVSRDFKNYALGLRTGVIKIFTSDHHLITEYQNHQNPIKYLEWHDDFLIKSQDIHGNFIVWHKNNKQTLYSYASEHENEIIYWDQGQSVLFIATSTQLKVCKDQSKQVIHSIQVPGIITKLSGTAISVFLSFTTDNNDLYIYDYLSNKDLFYFPLFSVEERRELNPYDEFESTILNFKAYLMNFNIIIPEMHYSLIDADDIIKNLKANFHVKEILTQINLNYYLYSLLWIKSVSLFRFWFLIENKKEKSEEWNKIINTREEILTSIRTKEFAMFEKIMDLIYHIQMLLSK